MTFRERLADWISGGALSRARDVRDKALDRLSREIDRRCDWIDERHKYRSALREIAACETPNANATVRRMAKIAKEALE